VTAYNIAGWVLVLLYAAIVLGLVIRAARRTRSMDDYALGSVHFSPVAVGLSLAASMTSAATFIINPGFIALYGLTAVLSYAVFLPLAAMASLWFFSKGFRRHGDTVKALTLSQWMRTRYDSPFYGIFFAVLSLLLITFIVLITVGLVKVLSKTLDVSEFWTLIGIVAVIFSYMMFGGANSMVYTNTIQASIMILVALILLGSGYEHFSEGVQGFLDRLRAVDPDLTRWTRPDSFLFRDWFEIMLVQMIVGVAIVMQPHIITKSLLLKTERDVNRYLLTGIVVEILFFSVVFAGLYARLTFPDLLAADGSPLKMDGMMSAYVLQHFPVWIGLLVILGLLSAGISTLEGLIQSLSTTITMDLLKPAQNYFLKASAPDDRQWMRINRAVIIAIAVFTVFLSHAQLTEPKLSVAIFAQNGVYAYFASAFVPILFGMFVRHARREAVISASVLSVIVHFTMYYGKIALPLTRATGENPAVAAATAIVASLTLAALLQYILQSKTAHSSTEAEETGR